MKIRNLCEEYNMEEITAEEIKEFEELIQLRRDTDNKILELKDQTVRKCLFKNYFIELTDDGLIVRNRNGAGGDMFISTDVLKKIEEYTGTRLIEIQGFKYKFAWGFRFKKPEGE